VEDQLAAQHLLATQLNAQSAALASSRPRWISPTTATKLEVVTYLEVATAQNAALENERLFVRWKVSD